MVSMVPWPSGKAKVCKTFTPQFKSGWHLHQTISFGWSFFFSPTDSLLSKSSAKPHTKGLPCRGGRFFEFFYSPSITASIRMPTMMMPMNMYCFLDSFSFRKMRDRIRDTTHTAEMMGAAMAPLPLAIA